MTSIDKQIRACVDEWERYRAMWITALAKEPRNAPFYRAQMDHWELQIAELRERT